MSADSRRFPGFAQALLPGLLPWHCRGTSVRPRNGKSATRKWVIIVVRVRRVNGFYPLRHEIAPKIFPHRGMARLCANFIPSATLFAMLSATLQRPQKTLRVFRGKPFDSANSPQNERAKGRARYKRRIGLRFVMYFWTGAGEELYRARRGGASLMRALFYLLPPFLPQQPFSCYHPNGFARSMVFISGSPHPKYN